MPEYDFKKDLGIGKLGEQALDSYLEEQGWGVQPMPLWVDKLGVDRIITSQITGERRSVEYKSEWKGGETGNACIEIIEVTNKRPGWGFTSIAQQLLIWVPMRAMLLWLNFLVMRSHLNGWLLECPRRDIINSGWTNVGILVPLPDLINIAVKVDYEAPHFSSKQSLEVFYNVKPRNN